MAIGVEQPVGRELTAEQYDPIFVGRLGRGKELRMFSVSHDRRQLGCSLVSIRGCSLAFHPLISANLRTAVQQGLDERRGTLSPLIILDGTKKTSESTN